MTKRSLEDDDEMFVELSVSGVSFTLLKKTVLDVDWILSKCTPSEDSVPWGVYHKGKYYIDGDPQSFRWILFFVKYNSLPNGTKESLTELEAIKSLADFLSYEGLIDYTSRALEALQSSKTNHELLQSDLTALKQKNSELTTELEKVKKFEQINENLETKLVRMEQDLEQYKSLHHALDNMEVKCFHCNASRYHRPYNRCGEKIVVLSPKEHDVVLDYKETTCNGCVTRLNSVSGRELGYNCTPYERLQRFLS